MPVYLIRITIPGDGLHGPNRDVPTIRRRIVKADNQAQAIKHVVGDTITCEVASVDEAMLLAAEGVKLEDA